MSRQDFNTASIYIYVRDLWEKRGRFWSIDNISIEGKLLKKEVEIIELKYTLTGKKL